MLYLRFNDERKRLMREMEESKLIIGQDNDSSRKKYVEKNSLEEIPENDEDDPNASEEHDIYDNQSSKNSKNSKQNNVQVDSNEDEKKKSDEESKEDSQSENSKSKSPKSNTPREQQQQPQPTTKKPELKANQEVKNEESVKPHLFNPYEANEFKKKNSLLNYSNKESTQNIVKDVSDTKQPNVGNNANLNIPPNRQEFMDINMNSNIDKKFLITKSKEKSKSGASVSANNSSVEGGSSFNHSSLKEANKQSVKQTMKQAKGGSSNNYNEKEINLQNLKSQKSALSQLSHMENNKENEYESDKMSNVIKDLTANPEIEALSANDINNMNIELSEHYEKKKNLINQTFLDKVDKIILFLEENKIVFNNRGNESNPLEMLKRLRDIQDINERNEMIDKIETIVAELFKNDSIKPDGNQNHK